MPRMNVPVRALLLSVALVLAAAAPAAAREAVVRSFDGTEIHVTFHLARRAEGRA